MTRKAPITLRLSRGALPYVLLSPAVLASISGALSASLHTVFVVIAVLVAVAFVVSLAFPHVPIEDLSERQKAEATAGA